MGKSGKKGLSKAVDLLSKYSYGYGVRPFQVFAFSASIVNTNPIVS